jgi:hypothetical protein
MINHACQRFCRLSGKMDWDYFRVEPAFASGKVVKTSNKKDVWSGPLKHCLIPQVGRKSVI